MKTGIGMIGLMLVASHLPATIFREVDGVIYYEPGNWVGWHHFLGAKVIQVVSHRGLLLLTSEREGKKIIFVKNYPLAEKLVDGEEVNFWALHIGILEYKSVLGSNSRVPEYDCGLEVSSIATDAIEKRLHDERHEREDAQDAAEREKKAAEEKKRAAERISIEANRAAYLAEKDFKLLNFQKEQAAKGLPSFEFDLAQRYLSGSGVATNQNEAKRLLEDAARQGYAPAAKRLKELERRP